MVKPLLGRLLWAAAGHAFGSSSSSDDGSSAILHLVLLLVLGGILIGTCLEVLCHRYHVAWMPGCALATLSGVAVGTLIRVTNDPEDIPSELLFSGNILFLVCLPIIIFDVRWGIGAVGSCEDLHGAPGGCCRPLGHDCRPAASRNSA